MYYRDVIKLNNYLKIFGIAWFKSLHFAPHIINTFNIYLKTHGAWVTGIKQHWKFLIHIRKSFEKRYLFGGYFTSIFKTWLFFFFFCSDVTRAESMKKPKRTPSFTTRRRTQSFRKLQKLENVDQLPPVEIQGFLDRKHELQSSGKKAAIRSWKTFYTGKRITKHKNKHCPR